uniref:Uncharacterized protein n=1 Tax=Anguilla anguilla TaxID=7936 RepID=A0A0E9P9E3_ANGAN
MIKGNSRRDEKKVVEIYQSGKVTNPFLRLWDANDPQ